MLRKLIKHEFRATGRILLPMFAIVLALAVGNNLSVRVLLDAEQGMMTFLGMTISGAYMLALFAMFVMCAVLVIKRFHSNYLTDEGYVMMTLPVSVHQLICSKLLVSLVWMVAAMVVLAVSGFISIFQVDQVQSLLQGAWDLVSHFLSQMDLSNAMIAVETVVYALTTGVSTCLMVYGAMAVGHSFPNHKVVLSVVAYFVIQWVLKLVAYIALLGFSSVGGDQWLQNAAMADSLRYTLLVGIGSSLLYCVAFYCITAYFLKRRLNLA